jgi:hypothetical protein
LSSARTSARCCSPGWKIDDPDRLVEVAAVGVDETVYLRATDGSIESAIARSVCA